MWRSDEGCSADLAEPQQGRNQILNIVTLFEVKLLTFCVWKDKMELKPTAAFHCLEDGEAFFLKIYLRKQRYSHELPGGPFSAGFARRLL